MIYSTVDEFLKRFPKESSISSADLYDVYLTDASDWIESCLASKFTVPFDTLATTSLDNTTATRLVHQKAYHLIRLQTLDPDDSDEMGQELDKVIKKLLDGDAAMMTNSGPIFAEKIDAAPGEQAWSDGMDFSPVFGPEDYGEQRIDPDSINQRRQVK